MDRLVWIAQTFLMVVGAFTVGAWLSSTLLGSFIVAAVGLLMIGHALHARR